LLQAYPELSLAKFVGFVAGLSIFGFMLVTLLSGSLLVGAVTGALGAGFPFLMVSGKRNRRQKLLSEQIPESLDFLSRILKAGHSFSTGLSMMGDELPQPIAAEFRRAYERHSLGQNLEDALRDMASRIESSDFAFFVTAVLIQRQTGGDLSEVLNNISGMIRQRIRLQSHVKAKTAEGRFTGYILVAFPAVMFVLVSVMNPAYSKTLTGTSTGQKLLALAFFLQVLGLWMIRKLTTVRV
jgi:tight adherence protein B